MQVDLFDPSAADGPRSAWQVIEAARRRYLTGMLVLETTPATHVYLRDGQVYFAERTTDGGLAVRLLVEGVLTRAQMQKATLQVSGVEHLGRMFERDDTIDRDAVELCVELMTDDVLTSIAEAPVEQWTMKLYQRHPSGIDRWLPTRVEVITHLVGTPAAVDPEATVTPAPRPRPRLTPPPVTGEVPTTSSAPATVETAPEPVVEEPAPLPPEPAVTAVEPPAAERPAAEADVDAPDVHEADGATPPTAEPAAPFADVVDPTIELPLDDIADAPAPPAPVAFAPIPAPFGEPVSTEVPVQLPPQDQSAEEPALAGLAPSAMEALMSGSIKDEVAEAVRRALASIDT